MIEDSERAELRRLMGRLAEGDRSAFRPVFALLWPRLRAFAVQFIGVPDGEDAAQTALLKVFSRASEYDRERDALAWALGIAAWECRSLRKRRERRREEFALAPQAASAEGATAVLAGGPSPEQATIDGDLRVAVVAVLGELRPIDVETILAIASGQRAVQGATFRKRVERALARFRLAWRARHGSD